MEDGAFHINRKSKLGYATRIYIETIRTTISFLTDSKNQRVSLHLSLSLWCKAHQSWPWCVSIDHVDPVATGDRSLPSLFLVVPAPPRRSPSIVFLGHPINTVAGARKTAGAEKCGGGLGQINGNHFGLVIREKLSFHWRRPIRPQGSTDLREFSIESQSSKRFRPRFRVTRTRRPFAFPTSRLRISPPFFLFTRKHAIPIFSLKGIREYRIEINQELTNAEYL